LSLILDYCTALSILLYSAYLINGLENGLNDVSLVGRISGLLSVACLAIGWYKERGDWYLAWHSLWHLLSAFGGYEVANALFDPTKS